MDNLITLQGFIGNLVCDKGDFKIYSFTPLPEYQDKVILDSNWGNICISGQLPDLYEEIEYIVQVEYIKKGSYNNYIVHKIKKVNNIINLESTEIFLRAILTKNQVNELLREYPDIIERVINNKSIDLSKTKGIKDKIFKVVKRKIIENYQLMDLVNEYYEYGMTFPMIQNLYEKYSSVEMIKQKMIDNPYECLCKINRVGFKTADKIIIKKYPERLIDKTRINACIFYLLRENESNGNTWIEIKSLYKQVKELVPECMTYFSDIIKNDEDLYFNEEKNIISTLKGYKCEQDIARILIKLLNKSHELNLNYKKFNNADGIPLTEEQMNTLKNVCKYNLSILAGVGGSGKSMSTKALVDMLDNNNFIYSLFSPTGKASKVLSQYTGKEAKTIHRGLGVTPEGFYYNKENKIFDDDLIIDEFSMIDIYLLRSLLEAVDENKTKILFIGDPFQIPSVGVGNIAYDMIQSGIIPVTLLTKVFRYNEGGLAYVASKVRNGEKYLDYSKSKIQTFGTKEDYTFINTIQENSLACIKTLYQKLYNQGISVDDIMVLSAYNKGDLGTIRINNMIQNLINPDDGCKKDVKYKHDNEIITLREGDKVMQVVNNYHAIKDDGEETCIFNGDCGIIKEIYNNRTYVDFDGTIIIYEKSDLSQLLLAYSISIHKSQGSSSKYVILITPKAHKFMLNRNLLYVAVSRAKEKVFHIGSFDTVDYALKRSANFERNTFLKDLLIEYNKEIL